MGKKSKGRYQHQKTKKRTPIKKFNTDTLGAGAHKPKKFKDLHRSRKGGSYLGR